MQTLRVELAPVSDDLLSAFFREIREFPVLSNEEMGRLFALRDKGSSEARQKLIKSNLSFAIFIANKYKNKNVPFLDLVASASVGLIHAVDRFDPQKKVRFPTYAFFLIRKELYETFYAFRLVRIPHYLQPIVSKVFDHADNNPGDSAEDISRKLRIKKSHVESALAALPTRGMVSLSDLEFNISCDEEFSETLALLSVSDSTSSDPEFLVSSLLGTISNRSASILSHYYGLFGKDPLLLREIGDMFDLSRERVRQIIASSLKELRRQANLIQ